MAQESSIFSIITEYMLSGVSLREVTYQGQQAFEMTMPSTAFQDPLRERLTDRAFMAWIPIDFRNGTIEVDIASDLAPDAPNYARGFAGVAFRIDPMLKFESIYLRPTNSRADDQVRRNHTVQYFAHPEYDFDRLRKESPEKYETYADIALGQWIHMKIVVADDRAKLFLNGAMQPVLLVNDLKLTARQQGGVGMWLESGSVVHFKNLQVARAD